MWGKNVKNSKKIFFYLIILQPVIDMITSITTIHFDSPITLGVVCRTLLLLILNGFIIVYCVKQNRKLLSLYLLALFAVLFSLAINFFIKPSFHFFHELNFAMKTGYLLTIIFTAIIFIQSKIIDSNLIHQAGTVIALMIGSTYWLALLTNTELNSYTYEGVGYSGWYYSANELSTITIIILSFSLISLHKAPRNIMNWLAFILILSMVPMIGTKTAFFGGLFLVFTYLIYLLYHSRFMLWRDLKVLAYSFMMLIFVSSLPFSPISTNISTNIQKNDYFTRADRFITQTSSHHEDRPFLSKILSSRDLYFEKIKQDYFQAHPLRQALGLGFSGDYDEHPKLIEMDYFDLFFSYGFIGIIFLLIPLIILIRQVWTIPNKIETVILLLALGLCFGISFVAGHVLFAPSVMTYLGLLVIILGLNKLRDTSLTTMQL